MHVRFPTEPYHHLQGIFSTVGRFRGGLAAVQALPLGDLLGFVVERMGSDLLRRQDKDVEDIAALGLHANRIDQHQTVDKLRARRGHIGCQPAAEGMAHEVYVV